jgi:hypothetical protein
MADEIEENGTLDFDQFWADHLEKPDTETTKKIKIFGEYYTLIVDIPFSLLIQTMNTDSNDMVGMSQLVDQLYGEGTLQKWLDKGMSLQQLPILMAWSIARIQGREMSFEEVAAQLKEFMGKGQISSDSIGPPLNRASRRATDKVLKKSGK